MAKKKTQPSAPPEEIVCCGPWSPLETPEPTTPDSAIIYDVIPIDFFETPPPSPPPTTPKKAPGAPKKKGNKKVSKQPVSKFKYASSERREYWPWGHDPEALLTWARNDPDLVFWRRDLAKEKGGRRVTRSMRKKGVKLWPLGPSTADTRAIRLLESDDE